MVQYCLFPTAIGDCGIGWRGDSVVATRLPDATPQETARWLASRADTQPADPPPAVQRAITAMTALLDGEKADLSHIVCDFGTVDAFSVRVYAATRAIPAGATATYGAIATQLGDIALARRVGQALGRNPIPIIVPCHRIIGANGKLVGFSADGGVALKLRMLEIEGAAIASKPGLFEHLPLATRPS